MSPSDFALYLKACVDTNVMSCRLVLHGDAEIQVTFGPSMPAEMLADPKPGGWKTEVSDPTDPDPLGLGALDAPFADEAVPE